MIENEIMTRSKTHQPSERLREAGSRKPERDRGERERDRDREREIERERERSPDLYAEHAEGGRDDDEVEDAPAV
jgi:hypothetical protein